MAEIKQLPPVPLSQVVDKIKIWERQRLLEEVRAQEIAEEINLLWTTEKNWGMHHWQISVCKLEDTYFLIDGQHRLHAYKLLQKKYEGKETLPNIFVFIELVNSDDDIKKSFHRINKLKPVQSIFKEGVPEETKKILEAGLKKFTSKLPLDKPSILSSSNNPQKPNLSENMMLNFFHSNAPDFKTADEFYQNLIDFNLWIKKKVIDDGKDAYKKAKI